METVQKVKTYGFNSKYEKSFNFIVDDKRKHVGETLEVWVTTPDGFELMITVAPDRVTVSNKTSVEVRSTKLASDEQLCPWCDAERRGFSREGAADPFLTGHIPCALCDE